jgi:hypothetical protein
MAARAELAALVIADPAESWSALGFTVRSDRVILGGIELSLAGEGRGITAWTLRNVDPKLADRGVDGLATATTSAPAPPSVAHANGAVGIDHVVVVTPQFDATAAALERAGMALRRIRDAGGGMRQGFRRLGPAILELVEAPTARSTAFWGLVIVSPDLDALRDRLAPHVGEVREAVQPGRHIAALAPGAGVSTRVAFMDPE